MKTIFRISLIVSALALPLCSCSDFLEKEPLSQGTEAIVFKTPEHFEQAANALYNMNGWRNLNGKGFEGSAVDQNTDINGLTSNGGGTVQESDWHWDKPYSHIRTCNILLAKQMNMMVSGRYCSVCRYCLFLSCMATFFICCNILVEFLLLIMYWM